MPPQINTEADISSIVNTIYGDAMLLAREQTVMYPIVKTFNDQAGLAPRKNTKYGGATFNQVQETDDLASQAFTPSVDQTLTPYEYAAQYFITDSRVETDPYSVRSDAATDLGQALGVKVDTLLVSTFGSFTGGSIGTAAARGDNFTWYQFYGGIALMRRALAPRPWVAVLSPEQWACLGTAVAPGITVTNSPYIQDEVLRQYFVGNVGGVDIFIDANIGTATSAVKAGMFSPLAVGLDWRRAPRLEPERDASRRGFELNMSAVFAYGVWRPQFGVVLTSAGTIPA